MHVETSQQYSIFKTDADQTSPGGIGILVLTQSSEHIIISNIVINSIVNIIVIIIILHSFDAGTECAVPTQSSWTPGQPVYLQMLPVTVCFGNWKSQCYVSEKRQLTSLPSSVFHSLSETAGVDEEAEAAAASAALLISSATGGSALGI